MNNSTTVKLLHIVETVLDYFAVILCSLLLLGTGLVTGFLYSIMK